MDSQLIVARVLETIVLLLSLTVHEFAHAWSAWMLGDDTASRQGRLSLNPLVHADLVGTILLPMLAVPFGWAKPVPVDPSRFRRSIRMKTGMMLTAAAGPLANIALAVGCAVALGLAVKYRPELVGEGSAAGALLFTAMVMNVSLAIFNLVPVPPLDGSRVVEWLLPARLRPEWESFARFAPFLLMGLVFFGSRVVAGPGQYAIGLLFRLIGAVGA